VPVGLIIIIIITIVAYGRNFVNVNANTVFKKSKTCTNLKHSGVT